MWRHADTISHLHNDPPNYPFPLPACSQPRPALCLALAALDLFRTAMAAEPQLLGSFRDWNAFSYEENGNKVCYMSSRPKKDEGNYKQRGDIYVLITHRREKSLDVVSVTTVSGGLYLSTQQRSHGFFCSAATSCSPTAIPPGRATSGPTSPWSKRCAVVPPW